MYFFFLVVLFYPFSKHSSNMSGPCLFGKWSRVNFTTETIQVFQEYQTAPGACGRDHRLFVMRNPPTGITSALF